MIKKKITKSVRDSAIEARVYKEAELCPTCNEKGFSSVRCDNGDKFYTCRECSTEWIVKSKHIKKLIKKLIKEINI